MHHVGRHHQRVKFFAGEQAEFYRRFAQRFVVFIGGFGDFCRVFVADFAVERRYQHQRVMQEVVDFFRHGFDADGAVLVKAVAGVAQEAHGLQQVVGNHRHIDVQLEVAGGACHVDGDVVAENLAADHGQRFALGRVHFAGHDGGAGLVFRDFDFTQTATRAGGEPAHVVGDFVEAGGKRFQRTGGEDGSIASAKRFEFVGRGDKGQAGELRQLCRGFDGEVGVAVEAGADGGAAERQFVEVFERVLQAGEAVVKLGNVAGEFLAEGERGGVLQVGAADFDDGFKGFGFGGEGVAQFLYCRNQQVVDFLCGGDVYRGREAVVGGLGVVHVVVRMHWLVGGKPGTGQFVGAVRQHFVHVHVGLCAGAGLPDDERELAVQFATQHVIGGADDEVGLFLLDAAEAGVGQRGGFFHQRHGVDERARQGFAADFEVLVATLGLRAPVGFGRNLDVAHGVVFGACCHDVYLVLTCEKVWQL